MTQEEKALAVLRSIAMRVSQDGAVMFSQDWGFGSATVTFEDEAHTHVGGDHDDDPEENFRCFVNSLHNLLVNGSGLSLAKP